MVNKRRKIYFAGAVRGGRQTAGFYKQLIKYLQQYGEVLNTYLGASNLTAQGENLPDQVIYGRDMKWLEEADWVVAEVSTPSLGVGYEIGQAVALKKRFFVYSKIKKVNGYRR